LHGMNTQDETRGQGPVTNLGIVINYCSNEKAFIDSLIRECSRISPYISVAYGDHMYDGTPEDTTYLLENIRRKYPHVKYVPYSVDVATDLYKMRGVVQRPTAYWCNLARWKGYRAIEEQAASEKGTIDWVLFLDADEIPVADMFMDWASRLSSRDEKGYTLMLPPTHSFKFANYWYFKNETNQSTVFEDSILMIHTDMITEDSVFHDLERDGILAVAKPQQYRMVKSATGEPMFHHYSWVRGRAGLTKKLKTWAHRDDIFKNTDVEQLIAYIYRNDDANDIIHHYTYKKVVCPWSFIF